ncbi:MAG: hypothetical protein SWQ30_04300 [Thermodesulfobacteriota bacterium]|nr:hypothetical protein [Thermodesulfobacteriota bacterium]
MNAGKMAGMVSLLQTTGLDENANRVATATGISGGNPVLLFFLFLKDEAD